MSNRMLHAMHAVSAASIACPKRTKSRTRDSLKARHPNNGMCSCAPHKKNKGCSYIKGSRVGRTFPRGLRWFTMTQRTGPCSTGARHHAAVESDDWQI